MSTQDRIMVWILLAFMWTLAISTWITKEKVLDQIGWQKAIREANNGNM